MRVSGHFFRASSSKKEAGRIQIAHGVASVSVDGRVVCEGVAIESVQNRRDIYLENGFLFTLTKVLSAEQERALFGRVARGISWLERFSPFKMFVLALLLIVFVFGLRQGLTFATPLAVSIFPHEWEEAIGRNTYETLNRTIFDETELPSSRVEHLRGEAAQLALENGFDSPEILFHKSDLLGANAVAFPGGPVVVTDGLVTLLESDELVLSVIAHEFAHIEQRHSLHQIVEVIGIAVIVSILFGANETLIEEASLAGAELWRSKKSRDFEREADLIAVEYLETAGLDGGDFSKAIEALTHHICSAVDVNSIDDCVEDTDSGWLSTHPTGAERLQYLSVSRASRGDNF